MFRQWLRPFAAPLIVVFVLGAVATGLGMIPPMGLKLVVDHVLLADGADMADRVSLLHLYGLAMVGLIVISEIIQRVRDYRSHVVNAKIVLRLRQVLFDRLLHLPLHELQELKTGGVVARLSSDVDQTASLIQSAIMTPLMAAIRFFMAIGFLFYISWQLAVLSIVILPPIVVLNALWVQRVRPMYRSAGNDRQIANARATETFGGIRVVRAFGREFKEQLDFFLTRDLELRKSIYARMHQIVVHFVWGVLMPGVSVLIIWVGGLLMLKGENITLGGLFAYQWYAMLLINPVWMMVNSITETQQALAAMERVFDVVDREIEMPDAPDAVAAPQTIREIRLQNVHFEYKPGVPVLHDINLSVPGGTMVAFVGPSGAGKTTLVNLIARFQDPTSGSILINGIDLRKIRINSFRQLLGVVEQEVFLFDGTVRENISYSRRGAPDEQIIEAAIRANADKFIREMPEGYDTVIGERGVKLSGGQRQRLSIARAILADPDILILDEATSNLDTESEQLIQTALNELFANRTTFVIAHRLSTIAHADIIVVLENGTVAQTGRHNDLIAQPGLYRDMVDRQRQAFDHLEGTLQWK